jgi:hypothetical protein
MIHGSVFTVYPLVPCGPAIHDLTILLKQTA